MKVIAKPVEMLVWFAKDGCPTPIKFRFEDDDGILAVINVDKILFKDIEKAPDNNMLILRCRSIIKNIQTVYELKYETSTMRWMLFKI